MAILLFDTISLVIQVVMPYMLGICFRECQSCFVPPRGFFLWLLLSSYTMNTLFANISTVTAAASGSNRIPRENTCMKLLRNHAVFCLWQHTINNYGKIMAIWHHCSSYLGLVGTWIVNWYSEYGETITEDNLLLLGKRGLQRPIREMGNSFSAHT